MTEHDDTKAPAEPEAPAAECSAEPGEEESAEKEKPSAPEGATLASPELEAAMQEALASIEGRAQPPEPEAPPPPTKKELELKLQILDLQHKVRQLEADLEKRTKEVRQNFEQAQRLKEQWDSYRARVQKEKADFFNYGHEPLLRELLPVIDNLERAIEHARQSSNFAALQEGVELTRRLFLQVLSKFGVEPIAALGQPFDPALHEAMRAVETAEAAPNRVVEEHQRGYLLRDRLLRPSMVTVSRPPVEAPGTATGDSQPEDSAESEPSKKAEGEV